MMAGRKIVAQNENGVFTDGECISLYPSVVVEQSSFLHNTISRTIFINGTRMRTNDTNRIEKIRTCSAETVCRNVSGTAVCTSTPD
jgi:hypothetical protein